jgi:hypothetical protein
MNQIQEARLAAKLTDAEFLKLHKAWIERPDTKEILEAMRDIFCRPTMKQGELNGEAALYLNGLAEGSWNFYETLQTLSMIERQLPEAKVDYGVSEEQQSGETGEK